MTKLCIDCKHFRTADDWNKDVCLRAPRGLSDTDHLVRGGQVQILGRDYYSCSIERKGMIATDCGPKGTKFQPKVPVPPGPTLLQRISKKLGGLFR